MSSERNIYLFLSLISFPFPAYGQVLTQHLIQNILAVTEGLCPVTFLSSTVKGYIFIHPLPLFPRPSLAVGPEDSHPHATSLFVRLPIPRADRWVNEGWISCQPLPSSSSCHLRSHPKVVHFGYILDWTEGQGRMTKANNESLKIPVVKDFTGYLLSFILSFQDIEEASGKRK